MVRQIQGDKLGGCDLDIREFRTFDGTRLTYYVTGEPGRPAMVIANGLGGNMLAWRHFVSFFAPWFRIYIWDYRGLFQSDFAPSLQDYTIPHHSEDLAALLDYAGIQSPVLVGWSMGVQVILEFLRKHQNKASAFIALNGTFGQPFRTAFHSDFLQKRFEGMFQFVKRHWERAIWLRPHVSRNGIVQAFIRSMQLAKIAGRTIDKDVFFDMSTEFLYNNLQVYSEIFVQLGKHNAYDALPHIHTPSLVIAGSRDSFIPAYVSKQLAQQMKNGEYWEIPGATHFCPLEFPHIINMRVKEYLSHKGNL